MSLSVLFRLMNFCYLHCHPVLKILVFLR